MTDTQGHEITKIPSLYGIIPVNLFYYTVFSIVMIPSKYLMDVFLLNTLELVHGWRLYDYVAYQKYRFSVRETRWQIKSQAFDESISPYLQLADLLCFSSQYYFAVAFLGYAVFLLSVTFEVMLRISWVGTFGDPWLGIIIVTVVLIYRVRGAFESSLWPFSPRATQSARVLLIWLGKTIGIWSIKGLTVRACGVVSQLGALL